jgi:hypothetical protein
VALVEYFSVIRFMVPSKLLFWADLIERFVDDRKIGDYEWDDYTAPDSKDPLINAVQEVCRMVSFLYPAKGKYCSSEGFGHLRELANRLRQGREATRLWIIDINRKHGLPSSSLETYDSAAADAAAAPSATKKFKPAEVAFRVLRKLFFLTGAGLLSWLIWMVWIGLNINSYLKGVLSLLVAFGCALLFSFLGHIFTKWE